MAVAGAPHLFCFGVGYTALSLARCLLREGWRVSGTCRSAEKARALAEQGISAHVFDRDRPLADPAAMLAGVTDLVSSVPPDAAGDAVLDWHEQAIACAESLRWVGYLSTTGVYGDTGGVAVDEDAPLNPTQGRSRRRVEAERRWLALERDHGLPVHVFRLAGIYGPGRSVFDQIRAGEARRIDRPGHLFSRIHVDDAVWVLRASMARPDPGRIYNVCDDEAAEPADVVRYACLLLGRPPPQMVPLEEAAKAMTPMALSFWHDNRRVDNARIKRELVGRLRYPDYRAGLGAILAAEAAAETAAEAATP
jgi:nucleoside-diphosphate-sugar epimerase